MQKNLFMITAFISENGVVSETTENAVSMEKTMLVDNIDEDLKKCKIGEGEPSTN